MPVYIREQTTDRERVPKGLLQTQQGNTYACFKLQPPLSAQAKSVQQDAQQAVSTIRNAQHML